MKIATFNVNNINKRLPNLLAWLESSQPDVACLQELKATDAAFPAEVLNSAGYSAIWRGERSWNGVAILARGVEPVLIRDSLPGDPTDRQSRYLEAAVNGVVIASIYLPNGNPQPGPKFDYKMDWFDRLLDHAAGLLDQEVPVVLAGDYNVVPTDFDIYSVRSFVKNALLQPAPRAAYARLIEMGWTDALRELHPDEPMFTFWSYLRNRWPRDERRTSVGPSAAQPGDRVTAQSRRCRPSCSRRTERERSRTRLGRTRDRIKTNAKIATTVTGRARQTRWLETGPRVVRPVRRRNRSWRAEFRSHGEDPDQDRGYAGRR